MYQGSEFLFKRLW